MDTIGEGTGRSDGVVITVWPPGEEGCSADQK